MTSQGYKAEGEKDRSGCTEKKKTPLEYEAFFWKKESE